MLVAEPLSRAAASALHLVEYQQQISLVGDPPQPLQKTRWRGHDTTLAQNGLHEDAAGLIVD